jgi:hypothetical protein
MVTMSGDIGRRAKALCFEIGVRGRYPGYTYEGDIEGIDDVFKERVGSDDEREQFYRAAVDYVAAGQDLQLLFDGEVRWDLKKYMTSNESGMGL